MDALTALVNKRDTRSYQDVEVEAKLLGEVLNAARMAGSAKNIQPVRLIVVTDQQTKSELKAGGDFASWIDQAPVLVVFTVSSDAGPRRLFDVGRHAQNLMVAATALGLATCPVTFHHETIVRSVLGIPDAVDAPMVVSLGHPAAGGEAPAAIAGPRIDLDSYVMTGRWQDAR